MQSRGRIWAKNYKQRAWYFIFIFIIMIVIFHFHWSRTTPYRVVKSFIRAVEKQDVETIYNLTIPQEREELGVTPDAIRIVLNASLWRYGRVIGKIDHIHLYGYWGIALGEWLDAKTGQPVPAAFGPPERPKAMDLAISFVSMTPEGWRVSTARFLAGRCFQTFGNLSLCRKVGIKGQVDVQTGYIIPLSDLEKEIDLLFRRKQQ